MKRKLQPTFLPHCDVYTSETAYRINKNIAGLEKDFYFFFFFILISCNFIVFPQLLRHISRKLHPFSHKTKSSKIFNQTIKKKITFTNFYYLKVFHFRNYSTHMDKYVSILIIFLPGLSSKVNDI